MSFTVGSNQNSSHLGKLIVRLYVGGLLLPHGIAKLLSGNLDFIKGLLIDSYLPTSLAYGVYIGEILAPVLLLVGFRTRSAAAVVAFQMLVIIFLAHSGDIFSFGATGGFQIELIYFYLFGAISLIFLGGGKYSVDRS